MNTFRDRHVVMTGGGGFVGSRLLERLVHGRANVIPLPGPPTAFFCDTQLAAAELGFRACHELVSGIVGEVLWSGSRRAGAAALITDGATA